MATDLHATWGVRIREKRRAAGLSQMKLAAAIGLDKSHLSRIERGEVVPNDAVRPLIARCLGMPVGELFSYPDEQLAQPAGQGAS